MKRKNNLFESICSVDNLHAANVKAQKGKKHYREIVKLNAVKDEKMQELHKSLVSGEFKNSQYETFTKAEPKHRVIYRLPYYPDRIVQHAIMNVCEEFWRKGLIRDTYAALKGRGIHDGVQRVKKFMRDEENTTYCLQMDIKKFYPSVNNHILYHDIIKRTIKCRQTLQLLKEIAFSTQGLPIGNYLSQIWGNMYMSPFDWMIKQQLRMKYYARYCDDLIMLHRDKGYLHDIKRMADDWLWDNLRLKIKNTWQVYPVEKRGVDFLGYVFSHDQTRIRKSIATRYKRKVSNIKSKWQRLEASRILNTAMSYYGWIKHANAWKLWQKHSDRHLAWIFSHVCAKENIAIPKPLRGIL